MQKNTHFRHSFSIIRNEWPSQPAPKLILLNYMDLFSLNGRLSPHEDNASTSGGRTEWPTNKRCHDFICQLRHYAQTTRCGGQFAEKEITTRASIWQANIRFSIPMSLSCSLSLCAIDDDGWSSCWDGYYVHCHCLDFFSRIVNLFLPSPPRFTFTFVV